MSRVSVDDAFRFGLGALARYPEVEDVGNVDGRVRRHLRRRRRRRVAATSTLCLALLVGVSLVAAEPDRGAREELALEAPRSESSAPSSESATQAAPDSTAPPTSMRPDDADADKRAGGAPRVGQGSAAGTPALDPGLAPVDETPRGSPPVVAVPPDRAAPSATTTPPATDPVVVPPPAPSTPTHVVVTLDDAGVHSSMSEVEAGPVDVTFADQRSKPKPNASLESVPPLLSVPAGTTVTTTLRLISGYELVVDEAHGTTARLAIRVPASAGASTDPPGRLTMVIDGGRFSFPNRDTIEDVISFRSEPNDAPIVRMPASPFTLRVLNRDLRAHRILIGAVPTSLLEIPAGVAEMTINASLTDGVGHFMYDIDHGSAVAGERAWLLAR